MSPVEYTPARRSWIREVTIGVAGGVGAELVRCVAHVVALLFGIR
ncbi:DUF6408 family protein [Streptomyces sp. NPDC001514]